ncbi:MAG: hypothetical protein JNM69_21050 [Archangium sp.]|nr:hypothetical protein [Archangium sp.]
MRRSLLSCLLLLACARRVEPVAPAPTCASRYVVRETLDDGVLTVNAAYSAPCAERSSADIEFSRLRVEARTTCPAAGTVVLEMGATERPMPADYAATLDERSRKDLTRTLQRVLSSGMTSVRAFVVHCAKPKWLLVATHHAPPASDQEPRVSLYEVAPEEPATAEPPPPPEQPLVTGTCDESLALGEMLWVGRQLSTGWLPGPSRLEQWTLGRTGERARLVIQEFEARREGSTLDVQPQGTFRCLRSTAWEGTVTGAAKLRFQFSQPPHGPTRELTCTQRTVTLASERARRVRVPSRIEGCNASRWTPRASQPGRILDCLEGSETHFFLGRGPGIEHLTFDGDDCGDLTLGLRSMPADGGVEPAVMISEQPRDTVPAHLLRTK